MSMRKRFSRREFVGVSLSLSALPFGQLWAATGCEPAVTNILGPAYRSGAPFRERLCPNTETGMPLTMSGKISDAQTCQPLAGCVLDVWQVDAHGDYDMTGSDFKLRGKFKTDARGRYSFDTIMPVPYGSRPKHIHYLITHPGYETRITQCYFKGDPRNDTDPYVKKDLIIKPVLGKSRRPGGYAGVFDVSLERERPPQADAAKVYPEFAGVYEMSADATITVRASRNKLFWQARVPHEDGEVLEGEFMPRAQSRFFVPEYDLEVTFVRNEHGVVDHTLDSKGRLARKKA